MPDETKERALENKKEHRSIEAIKHAFRVEGKDTSWTHIRHGGAKFLMGLSSAGFAVGFPRYFNNNVKFLSFPDTLDVLGMCIIGSYLVADGIRDVVREEKTRWKHIHSAALRISLGAYDIGFAVSFPQYFDKILTFPTIPNVLGTVAMGITSGYLLYRAVRDVQRKSAGIIAGKSTAVV